MQANGMTVRSPRVALWAALAAMPLALLGCTTYERVDHYGPGPRYGPPVYGVYGPPIGMRYDYDTYREVYIIHDRPGEYFHGGRFYRFRGGHWECADNARKHWRHIGDYDIPRGLRKDWKGPHGDWRDGDHRPGDRDRDRNRGPQGGWNDNNRGGPHGPGWNPGPDPNGRGDGNRFDPNDRDRGPNYNDGKNWQPQNGPGKPDSKGKPAPYGWNGQGPNYGPQGASGYPGQPIP